MKRLLIMLGIACVMGLAAPSMGQAKAATTPAATSAAPAAADAKAAEAKQDAPTTAGAAATPSPAPAASNAPAPNKGDVSWMLVSTALVLMMSVPALALFYG